MNAEYYTEIYLRDIQKLHDEIQAYPTDELLWVVKEGISNSGGNLCLHLVGNLQHFIGATIAHNGYMRNRDKEFSDKGLTKHELMVMLHDTQAMLQSVLPKLTKADLDKEFPFDFFGKRTTNWYLNQFLMHFHYHLGQINYHRRIVANGQALASLS
jgi:hypothetical protein